MRVRARVSPSGRPSYGDPGRTGICSLTSPSTCCCSAASRSMTRVAPSSSASASASSVGQPHLGARRRPGRGRRRSPARAGRRGARPRRPGGRRRSGSRAAGRSRAAASPRRGWSSFPDAGTAGCRRGSRTGRSGVRGQRRLARARPGDRRGAGRGRRPGGDRGPGRGRGGAGGAGARRAGARGRRGRRPRPGRGGAQRLVDAAHTAYGGLDGALVSVGGPPPGTALDTEEDAWRAAFESVFLGALRLTRQVAGALGAGRRLDRLGAVQLGAHADPRAGHLQRAAARPGRAGQDAGQRAGPARRPGQRAAARPDRHRPADRAGPGHRRPGRRPRAAPEAGIPLRRYGEPAEFGRVAAFVLSPAASYITGSVSRGRRRRDPDLVSRGQPSCSRAAPKDTLKRSHQIDRLASRRRSTESGRS